MVLLLTGVARHSLGEAFVRYCLPARSDLTVIGVDRAPNLELAALPGFRGVELDLDPTAWPTGAAAVSQQLRHRLAPVLDEVGARGVDCLVQAAGVYDFGPLLEHDVARRNRVLGVNLLGHVEVLHGVMALNLARGVDNPETLTCVEVGSFQGLQPRKRRALYAVSKAAGVDFCAALDAGAEVRRCVYFAPGPIDTRMLHENHWVTKANGPREFLESLADGPAERYRAIFRDCDGARLHEAAEAWGAGQEEVLHAFERYRAERARALRDEHGVLAPEECARMIAMVALEAKRCPAGVYFASAPRGGRARLERVRFAALNRLRAFRARAKRITWR